MLRALSALMISASLAVGQDEAPGEPSAPEDEQPAVRDLGNGKFEVGLVTFHRKSREISFQSEVNMQDGPLEYAIVHHSGKIHESILITKARPFHLNIALKLLGYKESKELFPILDDDFRPTGKYPKVPEATKNAARAEILLEWTSKEGKKSQASLNDWVTYTVTSKPLLPLPWVYGGSYVHNGSFQAEASGDIVALFTNNGSLFNWPGKDGNLDDVWIPTTKRIPDVGTSVKVTFKPFIKKDGAHKEDGAGLEPARARLLPLDEIDWADAEEVVPLETLPFVPPAVPPSQFKTLPLPTPKSEQPDNNRL